MFTSSLPAPKLMDEQTALPSNNKYEILPQWANPNLVYIYGILNKNIFLYKFYTVSYGL